MTGVAIAGITIGAVVSAAQIATNLVTIQRLRRIEMKTDELLTKVDDATNAAAERVTALIASIKASNDGTLTPAQEAEAAAIVSHLEAIGADAANPVPTATPSEL